jgi:mannosyltransferase OCH1-like enzyme
MIPKILHRVWLGDQPEPENFQRWHRRLRVLNPDWSIVTWDEGSLKALGIERGELVDMWPSSLAAQSNAVRLAAVWKFGGVYLDCDVEPLRPIPNEWLKYPAFAFEQDEQKRLCNAVFGAERQNPWVGWQIMESGVTYRRSDAAWGVYLMTKTAKDHYVKRLPPHLVYPFSWETPETERKPHPDSVLVHWWSNSWNPK